MFRDKEEWLYWGERLIEAQQWADAHPRLFKPPLTEFLAVSEKMQKYKGLISRAREWLREGRDESLLLRGTELRKAEEWLDAESPRELLVTGDVKEFVTASRKERNVKKKLKSLLAFAIVVLIGISLFADLQRRKAEVESDLAQKSEQKAMDESNKAPEVENLLGNKFNEVLSKAAAKVDVDQISIAAVNAERLNQQIQKSVRILYFYKEADGTKVGDVLKGIGYQVDPQRQVGAAPTNAIWWGEGVNPDDLKFIAYTLISNGFRIQYIGRVERFRDTIQIGGRPRSLAAPFWTVEQVSGLQKLPIDNERNTK